VIFARGHIDESLAKYLDAIAIDPNNEYAVGNIGLIYLKKSNFEKCIEFSTRALHILETYQNDTKSFARDNQFEVKLLLRRGTSYEKTN
jgi:tetratricopeptide (TPR) repeat protein